MSPDHRLTQTLPEEPRWTGSGRQRVESDGYPSR